MNKYLKWLIPFLNFVERMHTLLEEQHKVAKTFIIGLLYFTVPFLFEITLLSILWFVLIMGAQILFASGKWTDFKKYVEEEIVE